MALLIKNVFIIDGTGKPAYKSDVLIKGEKITAIKSAINYEAETIDGKGYYLCPGFIDVNNYADHRLKIFNSNLDSFLEQGITTIVGGQKGSSLAPVIGHSLETIKHRADLNKININWHSYGEFLKTLSKKKLGTNFLSLVGHSIIRKSIIGKISRNLTENELKILIATIEKGLKEGAFGVSVNLSSPSIKEVSYFELKKIAELTARYKAVISFNLNNKIIKPGKNHKEEIIESIKRIIFLAKETGVRILINDFHPLVGLEKEYSEALKLIEARSSNADICFNLYPYPQSTFPLRSILPDWAQSADREKMLENILLPETKRKILEELPLFRGEELMIINAPTREYLAGKTIKEFSKNRDLNAREGIFELMELTKFRAELIYKNINLKKSLKILEHELSMVASGGLPKKDFKPFKTYLEIAEEEKKNPLEYAVRKITQLPCQKLGIAKRGEIKEGNFADIVVFKNGDIKEVIVNGKRAVKDGVFCKILAGKALKHQI